MYKHSENANHAYRLSIPATSTIDFWTPCIHQIWWPRLPFFFSVMALKDLQTDWAHHSRRSSVLMATLQVHDKGQVFDPPYRFETLETTAKNRRSWLRRWMISRQIWRKSVDGNVWANGWKINFSWFFFDTFPLRLQ